MKKIHLNRLKKLADHLMHGKLGHKKFDFSQYNSGVSKHLKGNYCGTIGCAIGECPIVFPNDFKFNDTDSYDPVLKINAEFISPGLSGMMFFELTTKDFLHLFLPNNQYSDLQLSPFATKEQVAQNMYEFIQTKCASLNIPFESLNTEEV